MGALIVVWHYRVHRYQWRISNRKGSQIYELSACSLTRSRVWIALAWHPTQIDMLISTGQMGDLVLWDISSSRPRNQMFSAGHQRTIFSISFDPNNHDQLITTSLDRQIILWDMKSMKMKWNIPSLGGFVYHIDVSPHEADRLAIAVGDNTIRIWNITNASNPYDCQLLWKGLQSKVTTVYSYRVT